MLGCPNCRHRQEQDENEEAEADYASSSKRSKSSSRPAQQDEQQYSSWDGCIDKAAVEALLNREPDNPHHMHNIDRCAAAGRVAWIAGKGGNLCTSSGSTVCHMQTDNHGEQLLHGKAQADKPGHIWHVYLTDAPATVACQLLLLGCLCSMHAAVPAHVPKSWGCRAHAQFASSSVLQHPGSSTDQHSSGLHMPLLPQQWVNKPYNASMFFLHPPGHPHGTSMGCQPALSQSTMQLCSCTQPVISF